MESSLKGMNFVAQENEEERDTEDHMDSMKEAVVKMMK